MDRYVCIHGHFYQPPRENPWLESVELQDSAYPYHDWNERVTDECYAPNTASRILDSDGRIVDIVNNYARMSFNVGPTLMHWLKANNPPTYRAIIEADAESQMRFSGHGSALAQAYNHMILPLASREDKYTQIFWGIRDFQSRFRRDPEGMWLPETAVDTETLEILAEFGIKFTILAPHQAKSVRKIGDKEWKDVKNGTIDPKRVYVVPLPSGRQIHAFFYDGPVSLAVAFEDVLSNGEAFAKRVVGVFGDSKTPGLAHIATDGETYGHHHRYGDMALSYALHYIEAQKLARLTNYAEYLERQPATHEAQIFENSSWSCVHGIERWRSDCGCRTGGDPGWNQAWRGPLRAALDFLRDEIRGRFDDKARTLLKDPARARNEYIRAVLDRGPDNVTAFIHDHAVRDVDADESITILRLLELERHTMLMYTSCGWFFNELSGIETVQVMQYAGRAIQLADSLFGNSLEEAFLKRLQEAKSNIPAHKDGWVIYEKFVRPAMVDLRRVGAHYAVSSLFKKYEKRDKINCFFIERQNHSEAAAGKSKLAVGRASITSEITRESNLVTYGVMHLGDQNLSGGVREFVSDEDYNAMRQEVTQAFKRADFTEMIRLFEKHFGASTYSLRSLFRDEQRQIAEKILEATVEDAEAVQRTFFETNLPLVRFFVELGLPAPKVFYSIAEFIINTDLRRALEKVPLDIDTIETLLEEAKALGVGLDGAGLGYAIQATFEMEMSRILVEPEKTEPMQHLVAELKLLSKGPFEQNLWKVQNDYFMLRHRHHATFSERAKAGDENARAWLSAFAELGAALKIQVA